VHKLLYASRWLSLYQGYQGIDYVAADDGVMVVPLTPSGYVILIQEPTAYDGGAVTLVLPTGIIEKGEDAQASANRELQEEVGYTATCFNPLAQAHPWVKYLNVKLSIFLARGLIPSQLPGDEGYEIVPEYVPLNAFENLIAEGRLTDATSIMALFLARQRLADET
jgi:8-oxo-dGTP pyrophosphatase MutT (NUDIX family)